MITNWSSYHYSYFVGAIIFLAAWSVLFLIYRSGRHEMLIGSALAAPFAFSGFLFIPQYWTPPSLFNLDGRFGIGVEDILWSWCVGGLASVAGQVFLGERLVPVPRIAHHTILIPLGVVVSIFVALQLLFPGHAMYNLIGSFIAGSAVVAMLRRDLILSMTLGAATFVILYLALFVLLLCVYPQFIEKFYNLRNLAGFYVLGVPIEELEFAGSGGMLWAAIYAYSKGLEVLDR